MKKDLIVTRDEVEAIKGNANFGEYVDIMDVVKFGLLKSACGYYHGHTSTQIIIELGLITEKRNITKKGRENLFYWFNDITKEV